MSKVYYSSMRRSPLREETKQPENGAAVYGYLILLLTVAVLLIAYIWEYHQVLDLSEKIRTARVESKKLIESNHTMKVEIAALSTRSRIQRVASQKLELGYPEPAYVVWQQNPKDRFKSFETEESFFAKAGWIGQLFSIGSVEASDRKH